MALIVKTSLKYLDKDNKIRENIKYLSKKIKRIIKFLLFLTQKAAQDIYSQF